MLLDVILDVDEALSLNEVVEVTSVEDGNGKVDVAPPVQGHW